LGITVIEMAEEEPPHANLHPMRAIFVIPQKPAPTLADPDNWSPEMLDFIRCCCKKDPKQRHDSALLASHAFIKRDVNELRRIHKKQLGARHAYGRGVRDKVVGDSSNRQPGLNSLQQFMKRGSQSLVESERDLDHHPSYDKKNSKFDGHGADAQNFPGSENNRQGAAEQSSIFENKGSTNLRNSSLFSSDGPKSLPRSSRPMSSQSESQESNSMNAQTPVRGPGSRRMDKVPDIRDWNPNFDASGAFIKGRNDKNASKESNQQNVDDFFSPLDDKYKPPKSMDIEPSLMHDKVFLDERYKLSKTFETKLATLHAAHELAYQELITSSKLRNSVPLDVTSLMKKAAERTRAEKVCKQAISSSAHYSFMEGVVRSISEPSSMSAGSDTASPNRSHNSGETDYNDGCSGSSSIPDLRGLNTNTD